MYFLFYRRSDYHYALAVLVLGRTVRSSNTIVLLVVVCCESILVLAFVDFIAALALIIPCVGSWQGDLLV